METIRQSMSVPGARHGMIAKVAITGRHRTRSATPFKSTCLQRRLQVRATAHEIPANSPTEQHLPTAPGAHPTLPPVLRVFIRPAVACCLLAAAIALLHPPAALAAKKAAVAVAAEPSAASAGLVGLAKSALSFVLHLDVHLGEIVARYGAATYAILFGIVFAETGLVVTPFLPGDSLLFATGALAALGKLSLPALLGVYFVAATLGDAVNYASECFVLLLA
jgi:hypothetical protein